MTVFDKASIGSLEDDPAHGPIVGDRRPHIRLGRYKMIDGLEIRNFRAFKEAEITDLRRVNVIVGENGSGKTALLEAIFLAAGASPEIALRLRQWRGFEQISISGGQEAVDEALWRDLFHQFDTDQSALIGLRGKESRSLAITYARRGKVIALDRQKSLENEMAPVTFHWKWKGGKSSKVIPEISDGNLRIPPGVETNVESSFYAANRNFSTAEAATRFSTLSKKHKERAFIERFCEHYPNVSNITLEMAAGGPTLCADVKGMSEKIPLNLLSSGMSKLAAILLAMPNQPKGVLLVDEIENGFYFRKFMGLWETLLAFAEEYDSQIFVSTHSFECLQAAAEVAAKQPDRFSMLRTVRSGSTSIIRHFSGERFVGAVEEDIEVR